MATRKRPARGTKITGPVKTVEDVPDEAPTATATKPKTEPSARRGRASRYSGMVIRRLVTSNPRRPGTHGHAAWEAAWAGGRKELTFEKYRELPESGLAHLEWDIAHAYCEVVKPDKE